MELFGGLRQIDKKRTTGIVYMWLLDTLFDHKHQPKPLFAFQGSINWMRGLALLTENELSNEKLRAFYQKVQRRAANQKADALAYECLTMCLHNISAIESMRTIKNPSSIVRAAIVSWYYAVYYAAKAMLAASSGANPETHTLTGKMWQSELIDTKLVALPFSLSVSNLTPQNVQNVIKKMRDGNVFDTSHTPTTLEMAHGAVYSYLNGTALYEQWRLQEKIKGDKEFKKAGFIDFRSKKARQLRDARLSEAHVNFVGQAFRYRGKANYRDAIYLSYGLFNDTDQVHQFIADLHAVSTAFSNMAAHYVAKRVVQNDWSTFVSDLTTHAKFKLPIDLSNI